MTHPHRALDFAQRARLGPSATPCEAKPSRGGGRSEWTAGLALLDAIDSHAISGYQPCSETVPAPKTRLIFSEAKSPLFTRHPYGGGLAVKLRHQEVNADAA